MKLNIKTGYGQLTAVPLTEPASVLVSSDAPALASERAVSPEVPYHHQPLGPSDLPQVTEQPEAALGTTSTDSAETLTNPRRSTRKRKPKQREEVISLVERAALKRQNRDRDREVPQRRDTTMQDPDEHDATEDPDELADALADALAGAEITTENRPHATADDGAVLEPPFNFPLAKPRRPLYAVYANSHSHWFARLALLVTAFLHTRQNVSFRSCAILLALLNSIFLALGVITFDNELPLTLDTVLRKFELEDRFIIYPLCKKCHRIFQPNIPSDSVCPDCDEELFRTISNSVFRSITGCNAPPPPPFLVTPIQVLSSLLVDCLSKPGIEHTVESYSKTRILQADIKTDISDGEIWKNAKCPDGTKFFDRNDDSGELRIGVTMSLDW